MFADLVEQQTTTTGTSSYVVSGSVVGRRTFASAFTADTKTIPYVVTDDVGGYEVGIGDWTLSTTTLSRVVIIASSNANAAVSWTAGTRRIYLTPHSGVETAGVRNNYDVATASAPTTSNNLTQGYGIGSRWLVRDANGGGRMYECLGFVGASAIWAEMAAVSKSPIASSIGRIVIGQAALTTPNIATSALNGFGIRGGFDTTGGTTNFADGFTGFTMWAHTTNATATDLSHSDTTYTPLQGIYLPANTSASMEALVTASTGSGGDRAMWKLTICAKGGTTPTVDFSSGTSAALFASAGASAWAVAVSAASSSKVKITVTGAAATDIMWSAMITGAVTGKV